MDWNSIAKEVVNGVTALEPFVAAANPAAGAALSIATKIAQGAIAAEPLALALYKQIKSGTPPTPTQLQQFMSDYEAAYQTLDADIKKKLAALPAA